MCNHNLGTRYPLITVDLRIISKGKTHLLWLSVQQGIDLPVRIFFPVIVQKFLCITEIQRIHRSTGAKELPAFAALAEEYGLKAE